MENKEYYTPEIFELFVGWEGEVYREYVNVKGATSEWVPFVYGKNNAINYFIYNDLVKLRCKYLCKQDITDLGFIYNGRNKFYTDIEDFQLNTVDEGGAYLNYFLQFGEKEHYIQIEEMGSDTLFQGTCKSKNEFFKLMKDYLNIPV